MTFGVQLYYCSPHSFQCSFIGYMMLIYWYTQQVQLATLVFIVAEFAVTFYIGYTGYFTITYTD